MIIGKELKNYVRKGKQNTFFRFCKKEECGKRFKPSGKFQVICEDCRKKNMKEWREKNKLDKMKK